MKRASAFLLLIVVVLLPGCLTATNPPPTRVAPAGTPVPPATLPSTPVETPTPVPATVAGSTPVPVSPTRSPLPSPTPQPTSPAGRIPLPHYDLSVHLDYDTHFVEVEETVTVANGTEDTWTEVVFNVSQAYWNGVFSLQRLEVALGEDTVTVRPAWDVTMLHVALPRPVAPAEAVVVDLAFTLSLPRLDPYGWGPAGNAGWAPDVTQLGDWYPALVPYVPGSGWQTWQYHPVGDPVRSGLGDYDVTIVAPAGVTIAAAGFAGEGDGAQHYHLEQARAFAFLASRDFVLLEGDAGGIPLRVYVTAARQSSGPVVLETMAQALQLYEQLFGPYPYPELVMAENGFLTAMEYSALVSLSGFAFETYDGTAETLLVAITAHEVAHQWWYGAVGNDQVDEPWLDESLAMMGELLFYEAYYPEHVAWWWFFRVDRWEPTGVVDVSVTDYDDSPTFVHNMYGMAARFMGDLRTTMGEETFLSFLRAYYARERYQTATGEDFFTVARTFISTAKLIPLVETYFRQAPTSLLE